MLVLKYFMPKMTKFHCLDILRSLSRLSKNGNMLEHTQIFKNILVNKNV